MKHSVNNTLNKITQSFSRLAVGLSASALLLMASNNDAHAVGCLTSSVNITTGINPATSVVLPIGAQDPAWMVVALTPTLTPPSSQTIPYHAYTVLGDPTWQYPWPTSPNSNWISFNTYSSYSTLGGTNYSMTLRRTFKTCVSDKLAIYFKQFSFDQTIQVLVDGVLVYSNSLATQYQSFTSTSFYATPTNTALPAGTHTLDVVVYNNAGHYSVDGHGLNIIGNVASTTNTNSLVSEIAGCESAGCTLPRPLSDALSVPSSLYQNAPNPFNNETKISYFVKDMKSSAQISVFDMNGKMIVKLPINKTGEGSFNLNKATLQPGMYSYSLMIDGAVIDTKRMVVIP